jgi:hypothetical protein
LALSVLDRHVSEFTNTRQDRVARAVEPGTLKVADWTTRYSPFTISPPSPRQSGGAGLEHPSLLVRDPEWPDEISSALGDDGISF